MSICPFWSNTKKRVECNNECPMNNFFSMEDNCPFKEYLEESNIDIKGIDEGNFEYNENLVMKYIQSNKR